MNKLKLWRLERGLSQMALADSSGVPRHVIQMHEIGLKIPNREHQAALAKTLGVKLSELFPQRATRLANV